MVKVIVHTDDLTDMVLAMRAVKDSVANGYDACGYRYGEASAFTQRNKSGSWSVWVQSGVPTEGVPA